MWAGAALAIPAAWIAWGNQALQRSEMTIVNPKIPAELDAFCIAQISDLHNAQFGTGNRRLLEMVRAAQPDCIALTGDLVDSRRTDLHVAVSFARQAVQIAPVYYVPGNHEARLAEYAQLKAGLQRVGVVVLEDQCVLLEHNGGIMALAGLRDPGFAYAGRMQLVPAAIQKKLMALLDRRELYSILLVHRPEWIGAYACGGADLVLSGHAHGGQFRLPLLGGLFAPGQGIFPKYHAGLYTVGSTNLVVSRGVGNSLFPFRVNNRPEVVVVRLRREGREQS